MIGGELMLRQSQGGGCRVPQACRRIVTFYQCQSQNRGSSSQCKACGPVLLDRAIWRRGDVITRVEVVLLVVVVVLLVVVVVLLVVLGGEMLCWQQLVEYLTRTASGWTRWRMKTPASPRWLSAETAETVLHGINLNQSTVE